MKKRIFIRIFIVVILILEILLINIKFQINFNKEFNIFQYIHKNINQLYLSDNPFKSYNYNDFNNHIQKRNYVSNYNGDNNTVSNIDFVVKQNLAIKQSNMRKLMKTFQIIQTTKYEGQEIKIVITSTIEDNLVPMLVKNYYLPYDSDYRFSLAIDFNNRQLPIEQQIALYNLCFTNFK